MDLVLEMGLRSLMRSIVESLPRDSGQDATTASSAYRIGHNDGMRLVAEKVMQYLAEPETSVPERVYVEVEPNTFRDITLEVGE